MRLQHLAGVALVAFLCTPSVSGVAAPQVSISITYPHDGATISGANVPLVVDLKGLKVDCGLAGKAPRERVGHWHVILDDRLVDMACGPGYLVSLRNVKPGQHTLMAVPAQNNHMEMKEGAAKVTFTYRPEEALPRLGDLKAGKPRLSISFPKNGTPVSGQTFPLVVNVQNFRLSCEMLGKPQLTNTGHWHVHLDKMAEAMAAMATMLFMGCTNTFDVPLKGIAPGSHTFIVVLVDTMHYPVTPMARAQVIVRVK